MQIVLRLERADPPSWHRAVAAAAAGAAALCLDPRSDPGGEWDDAIRDYCRGHIRKVTRRARAGHWAAAQDLPGITLADRRDRDPGAASPVSSASWTRGSPGCRSAAPMSRSTSRPPRSRRTGRHLQLWVPAAIAMTVGKAMAQAGHAGMIMAALLAGDGAAGVRVLRSWLHRGCPVSVRARRRGRLGSGRRRAPDEPTDQATAGATAGCSPCATPASRRFRRARSR